MVDFALMESGSWYTITGCGGDLTDWKNGYQEMMTNGGIGIIREWVAFTGGDMNAHYGLTGTNAYPDDLRFLAFPLDGLDVGRLAVLKILLNDRWFDDIVANNAERQKAVMLDGVSE